MSKISPIARKVSMVPAMYIHVAGGLNFAATKNPRVAGSVNLPTICGMKNSPHMRRRITIPLSKLNLSAHDMLSPRDDLSSFQWIAEGGARLSGPHPEEWPKAASRRMDHKP